VSGPIVVDTSALLAAAFAEPQRDAVLVALSEAESVRTSACCYLEGSIVAFARLGGQGRAEFSLLLDAFGVEVVSLTPDLSALAMEAWERWGKGRHPAGLNIVDCCSYALAAQSGEPLLAVGDDFARTDLGLARLPTLVQAQGS
jgi:ribonuclease VapC